MTPLNKKHHQVQSSLMEIVDSRENDNTTVYLDPDSRIRYTLVKSTPTGHDWLFLPGGPGCDSGYFFELGRVIN